MPETANTYLIVGEDDYLAEAAARKILEAAVEPSLRTTAVETIPGEAGNAEAQFASLRACVDSVQTPPFLDPVKLTWWRGVDFLPAGGNKGPSADVKVALEKFAADLAAHPLPSNQYLIITAKRALATSIFVKTFKTFAQVVEFAAGGRSRDRMETAQSRLPDLAETEGLSFDPGADGAFLAKVGTDTRTIVSELAKLRTYLGNERSNVTTDDVARITSVGSDEPEIWDITDAVARRDPVRLLKALARFDGEKGFGILLSSVVEKFFREGIVYRDAIDNGWLTTYGTWAKNLPPDVAEDLDAAGVGPNTVKSPWALKNGARNVQNFTLRELRVARFKILQAREKLVSSSADDSLVAQELLRIVPRPRRTA